MWVDVDVSELLVDQLIGKSAKIKGKMFSRRGHMVFNAIVVVFEAASSSMLLYADDGESVV